MSNGFPLLHPVLRHHIVNTLGWRELRPLQDESIGPIVTGSDVVLIAPTAGGKTEAAVFPLISLMAEQNWEPTSVLYVCPLKALLNNLAPRLDQYAAWVGRTAKVWHGDVGLADRRRIQLKTADVLLTTPESLESMLVSPAVDVATLFAGLRSVVIDEVHSFTGDDRGWHLLAVLARIEHLIGRRLQRIGMSATVGNPDELLVWLRGGHVGGSAHVIAPRSSDVATNPDITVDHVGSIDNAAKVIAALHHGEKRLVFTDSRRLVEQLAESLRCRGVETYVSHSSLSAAERRRAEQAFADAKDCVIVATSTLELGIDVGDLDRVIQIDGPRTVSSFLQRLGRTGRRPGSVRNCLFLCVDDAALLRVLGLLQCWSRGWVEPVVAPPLPRHIAAQQLLALALQTSRLPLSGWRRVWEPLPLFDASSTDILEHLLSTGMLEQDSGTAFIGVEAEKHFGRRRFMDLLAVFTSPPQFTVYAGRSEVGSVEPGVLTDKVDGARVLLLGGRSWKVTHIDWRRHACYVESSDLRGRALWRSHGDGLSFQLCRATREVLLGSDPPVVTLTRRARTALTRLRDDAPLRVDPSGLVVQRVDGEWRWWTWAGTAANRTLSAWLETLAVPGQSVQPDYIRIHGDMSVVQIRNGFDRTRRSDERPLPDVDDRALRGLKFSAALPDALARTTLAARHVDIVAAQAALDDPLVFRAG